MADTPLPRDWNQLLDRFADTLANVQQRLDKAASGEETEAKTSLAQAHAAPLDRAAARHAGLSDKVHEITRWVDAIESELRISEDLVRVLLTQTESVRQKLATWAGRAIG